MALNALSLATWFSFTLVFRHAHGHGAVVKPVCRALASEPYCPWCIGGHVTENTYGTVNKEARPASPCGGTSRGDAVYPRDPWGEFSFLYPTAEQTYEPGGIFESTVVLNADHNGEAQWQLCPHSEAETEDCFRRYPINEWIDVHAYWDANNEVDHWKSGEYYPQTVRLPPNLPVGRATLRWIWVCRWTDEIFTSCIDVSIGSGGSSQPGQQPAPQPVPQPVPQPAPQPTPQPAPQPPSVPGGLDHYCYTSDCNCPPFTDGPEWCDANTARMGSAWCQSDSTNCGHCNGNWCDVMKQGLTLPPLAGPGSQDSQDSQDSSGGGLVSAGIGVAPSVSFLHTLLLGALGNAFM